MKKILFLLFVIVFRFPANAQEQEKTYAEINGTRIHYELSGEGTTIIFIHGWSFDLRCWADQVKELSKKYKVLTYDLRGFGQSALPELDKPYSHTEDLVALMDYLKIEKAILVGHSFGGRIAFDFTFQYPNRVVSLVLPEAAMDANDFKPPDKELLDWIISTWTTGQKEGIEKAKEIWIKGSPLKNAMENPLSSGIVSQMIKDYSGWQWTNKDPQIQSPLYSIKKLNTIKVPTLIIYGEKSPPYYYEITKAQQENISNSKLVMLKNAGHALNNENPEQFNKELLKFLKESNIK